MSAFSNGTEWEVWSYNWCHQCSRDEMGGAPEGTYCDVIAASLVSDSVPPQWIPGTDDFGDRYHCTEFEALEGPDDGVGPT